jgi:hypothetical protein
MTNGALKALDDGGFDVIRTRRLSNTQWRNMLDEKKTFDPKELTKDLTKLAAGQITRRLSHPAIQAAVLADDAVRGLTGKSVSERVGEGYRQTVSDSIKKRLKNGERFILPQSLPY